MKNLKKLIALMTAALLFALCFTGCGNKDEDKSDLEYVKEKGTLVVGVTDFEPLDYEVDGQWTGFDAELAKLVGEKLGVKVEFQLINWDKKEAELAGKTIDCIWNGLTWDEDRAENMGMSDYYMKNRQVVVISSKNADKFKTADDLKNVVISAETGSAGEDFINAEFADATYIEKDAQIDVLTELLAGTSDAGVIDYVMANYLINKEGSDFASVMILDDIVTSEEEYYSVAFRKGSDLTAKVNELFAEFKTDGTIDTLANQYGLVDALVK